MLTLSDMAVEHFFEYKKFKRGQGWNSHEVYIQFPPLKCCALRMSKHFVFCAADEIPLLPITYEMMMPDMVNGNDACSATYSLSSQQHLCRVDLIPIWMEMCIGIVVDESKSKLFIHW